MSGPSDRLPGTGIVAERLLLREFSHRVNDELASAIRLISVAANRSTSNEARAALGAVRHRLQEQARLHHSLQMPDYTTAIDLAAYLCQLCRAISHSMLEGEGIGLSLSVHPLRLDSERCWLLGMIVFGLVTNAARHAFDRRPGSIRLEVRPTGASIECSVTDNRSSAANSLDGQDLAIIEALAAGLHATVDMQSGPDGARTIIDFPYAP